MVSLRGVAEVEGARDVWEASASPDKPVTDGAGAPSPAGVAGIARIAGVDLEVAQRAPLFKGLSLEQIATVLGMGVPRTFKAGEVMIVEGDTDTDMYVVLRGKVDILKRLPPVLPGAPEQTKSLVQLEAPRMGILLLGEMNMLRPDAGRSTTVMPVEECQTLVLTKEAYEELGQRDPLVGYIFTRNIAQKIVGDLAAMNARVLKLTQALSIALDRRR